MRKLLAVSVDQLELPQLTCSKGKKLCADLVRTRFPSQAIGLTVRVPGEESEV